MLESGNKRRGRPHVSTGKDSQWHIRTTPKDNSMMDYLVEKRGMSKTEIIMDAVRAQYNFELAKGD